MTPNPPRQPHEHITRADRLRMLLFLNGPDASSTVKSVLPTVNALLSNYLHRQPAKLEYSNDSHEWLANHSRFLTTDAMSAYGPMSGQLPVMALTTDQLLRLQTAQPYLIPFLIESADEEVKA